MSGPFRAVTSFGLRFRGLHPRLLTVSRFVGLPALLRLTHCYARTNVKNQEKPPTTNFCVVHPGVNAEAIAEHYTL